MDEVKLSEDVFEQIKDFSNLFLTKKQESLIDKLILDEELKKRYIKYRLCYECKQPNTGTYYCQACRSKHFQQNFKIWTSGNHNVDEFIQKTQLKAKEWYEVIEWIEYNKFENIEYLAKGGFGTIYKAVWRDGPIREWVYKHDEWRRNGKTKIALKCLHNSQDITVDFLKEVESHVLTNRIPFVVRCYGITKDPKTNNFMMVMDLKVCSLRQHLNSNFISLDWNIKIISLLSIASGLETIHNSGLVHHDFHCGNILSDFNKYTYITDLGLCQPANVKTSQDSNKKIHGVLPYVAPEVLRGKEYTQASDIYGFGIIAYEICTGLLPYHDVAHDDFLAMKICQGLRPSSNYKIPKLLFNIIIQCWDANPLKRPNADELRKLIYRLYLNIIGNRKNSAIYKQTIEADEINKKSTSSSSLFSTGTLSVYTSRVLDFKNLPEPKNADNNDNLLETEYSDSLKMDFTKLDINSKGKDESS